MAHTGSGRRHLLGLLVPSKRYAWNQKVTQKLNHEETANAVSQLIRTERAEVRRRFRSGVCPCASRSPVSRPCGGSSSLIA